MADVDAWVEAHWRTSLTVREWWRLLVDAGYAHPTWPLGVGGIGATAGAAREILATLARHGVVAPAVGGLGATLAAPTILAHGTEHQIETLVRAIALGERSWCQLFSEPGSGSDLASVATRAARDGDEWVVSGQKVWSSSADAADMGMLLARTDADVPKHQGLTYFLLDMHQPGVEVRPLRTMNGRSPFCEVFLSDARVPARAVLGEVDDGWRIVQTTLAHERASVAGGLLPGLHPAQAGTRGDLDRTVGEVIERAHVAAKARPSRLRGGAVPATVMIELAREQGVAGDSVVRQRVARYVSHVRINGWTLRRSAAAGGRLTGADGSIAKLTTASICQESRDLSYAIVGARGMLSGAGSPMAGDLQSVNLASPGTRIGGGTDEIQRSVIAEKVLGLPREPNADRDVPYRQLRVGTQR